MPRSIEDLIHKTQQELADLVSKSHFLNHEIREKQEKLNELKKLTHEQTTN